MAKNEIEYKKNIEIEIITPLIAPALSPNKPMKQMQIQDLKKCYATEIHELVNHIDRAFERDLMCNALISSSTISGALREQYQQYSNIIVTGMIIFSKDFIRIGTKRVSGSLMQYEYLVPGAKAETILTFTQNIKLPLIVKLGAKKNKGYGIVKLSQI